MAQIAYILLCHRNAEAIEAQVKSLVAAGDCVAVHFDRNGSDAEYRQLYRSFARSPNVVFVPRVRCGWGEWTLVKASLDGLRLAEEVFEDASHFFLISGDCSPIKSARYIHDTLDTDGKDYIEHQDFFSSGWIKTGLKEDRLHFRHFFNERSQKRMFYGSYEFQKLFDLRRVVPEDLEMRIGSQWWCLRRSSVEALLKFVDDRRDVIRFFKSVWIPDECFFQTVIMNVVSRDEIVNEPPTFLMFSDYGKPVTFHVDHMEFLKRQKRFFARKITEHSSEFRHQLQDLYTSEEEQPEIVDNGIKIYDFLTQRGRHGKRFGKRFWESGRSIGAEKDLLVIVSAKRDFTQHLLAEIAQTEKTPAFGYVFNDENVDLPNLGGIETSLQKRTMHRRAFMHVLFEVTGHDKLVICIDPSTKDIFDDLGNDACNTRVLFIEGDLEDHHLERYAERRGLLSDVDSSEQRQVLNALKQELSDDLSDFQKVHQRDNRIASYTVRPHQAMTKNTKHLADFLGTTAAKARDILRAVKDK